VYTKDPFSTINATTKLVGAKNEDHDAREVAITIGKGGRVEGRLELVLFGGAWTTFSPMPVSL
jgi:hypothetical protein